MKRTERISISVTPEEKKRFRMAAAERDMDMAELLRKLALQFLDEEVSSEGNPNDTPQLAD